MKKFFFSFVALAFISVSALAMDPVNCTVSGPHTDVDYFLSHTYCSVCTNLTPTGKYDGGKELMLTVAGDSCKISDDKCFIDFHWSDPSSVVFDNIYVSEDGFYDITWYYVLYTIDGEPTLGSLTHFYVNDELYDDDIVFMTVPGTYVDHSVVEGAELYADWPNVIRLTKGNGWPLVYGIQLKKSAPLGVTSTTKTPFKVIGEEGQVRILRLEANTNVGVYSIAGTLLENVVASGSECVLPLKAGVYVLRINDYTIKTVVR